MLKLERQVEGEESVLLGRACLPDNRSKMEFFPSGSGDPWIVSELWNQKSEPFFGLTT